jgi:tRNA-Thr(GGU) m(6)t(6)A37 methyltransferase TsaA
MQSFTFQPIGVIETCFKEKFGIPRQPGLSSSALGTIKLRDEPDLRTAIRELEKFSHLWVIFVFHEHGSLNWKPSIRPPRLGGARKVGVLASRSPHRPNPIGLSAVKVEAVRPDAAGGAEIEVSGVDILDGSPVLDVKPYIPYADSIPDANAGWAAEPIERVPVEFTPAGERALAEKLKDRSVEKTKALIIEMLELDPRPAFQKRKFPRNSKEVCGQRYGIQIMDFDVKWEIHEEGFKVTDIGDIGEPPVR